MSENIETLKYPIGKYESPISIKQSQISIWIDEIKALPAMLRQITKSLDDSKLDTEYRPEGWTVRQVIHHIAESHMNSFIRFKWTLTEDNPTIKTYHEDRWAMLDDTKIAPIDFSLDLIEALHKKWAFLLESMSAEDFNQTLHHPEMKRNITLGWMLGLYAWHGEHHYQHINQTLDRNGWL